MSFYPFMNGGSFSFKCIFFGLVPVFSIKKSGMVGYNELVYALNGMVEFLISKRKFVLLLLLLVDEKQLLIDRYC